MFYFCFARGTDTWWHWAGSNGQHYAASSVVRVVWPDWVWVFSVSFLREETFYPHFPDMILDIVIVRSRDTRTPILYCDLTGAEGGAPWGEGWAKIDGNTRFPLLYNWLPYVQVICSSGFRTGQTVLFCGKYTFRSHFEIKALLI